MRPIAALKHPCSRCGEECFCLGGDAVCYHCDGHAKPTTKLEQTQALEREIEGCVRTGACAMEAIRKLTALVGSEIAQQVLREIQAEAAGPPQVASAVTQEILSRWPDARRVD